MVSTQNCWCLYIQLYAIINPWLVKKRLLPCLGRVSDFLGDFYSGIARSGTVDTARELLEHGADACGPQLDVTGKGVLDYAHSPDMVTFFLESDYLPSLDVLTRQLRISPDNARAILATCLR